MTGYAEALTSVHAVAGRASQSALDGNEEIQTRVTDASSKRPEVERIPGGIKRIPARRRTLRSASSMHLVTSMS